jgi:hypothetical protein
VCQQGTRLTNNILKLKITTKKSALESFRQIIRQKPAKASGVRQPEKVQLANKRGFKQKKLCYVAYSINNGSIN